MQPGTRVFPPAGRLKADEAAAAQLHQECVAVAALAAENSLGTSVAIAGRRRRDVEQLAVVQA
jgi:hypothetical protein